MRNTPSESPRVAELRALPDPVDRAAACQAFLVNGRSTLAAVEVLRNESIRAARETTVLTVDQLAARVKVKRNIIVEALRRKP